MFKKINSLEEKKKQHQRDTVLYVCCFPSKKKKKFPLSLNQTSYLWKNMVS